MSSRIRKYPSDSEKRKRKKRDEDMIKSLKGSMDKYLKSNMSTPDIARNPDEWAIVVVEEAPEENNVDNNMDDNNVSDHEPVFNSPESASVDEEPVFSTDIYDPINWDNLDNKVRDMLVEKGPQREENFEYPLDADGRHFSYIHYSGKLSNGENSLGRDGFYDWRHISVRLKEHEASVEHLTNMKSWNELRARLSKHETIDKELQQEISKEKERISLAFRGSSEQLYNAINGNF
ncbi:zinc finger MYM-type protein 5-like [Brachypodium distachyon]|uniref:zinc finger MYM-type protein 5-like n=1 Tax=Brachypodium distachyon TaxID=15368 RepID=UPI00071E019B|nr:zinc finger MYM-type protein 5-like [Brachypodium distachyon]|eukprot:XP_014757882.1 zinc finger MYM-type protein 5-like [Brachypodium distachyon]